MAIVIQTNDTDLIRKTLSAYNEFCFDFHSSIESWNAKAVDVVTSQLNLSAEEAVELRKTIHAVANEFSYSRVNLDADCNYTIAADVIDIRDVVRSTAMDSEFYSFPDFKSLAESNAHSELFIRIEDGWILEEAIDEFAGMALMSIEMKHEA